MKKFYDTTRELLGHILVIMVVLVTPIASSAELYKYRNEDGVTVLNSYIPARYVKNGYTILSLDGRVLEDIPRALTNKEIRARDSALLVEQTREREEREKKIADQNLLILYGTPEDVTRARDTKLASIDSFITTQQGKIHRLENQKRELESSLAGVERAGGTVSNDRVDRIRSIEGRKKQIEAEIRDKQEEKVVMTAKYAADLKRVLELYGIDSSS